MTALPASCHEWVGLAAEQLRARVAKVRHDYDPLNVSYGDVLHGSRVEASKYFSSVGGCVAVHCCATIISSE